MKHELTVTLRPMMYSKTPKEQFAQTSIYMLQALYPYKHTTVAELTQEQNVHYHSIVEIDGILDKEKLLNRFRQYNKFLGRKTCTAVQYEESYENYIKKDIVMTSKIIYDPVVKDDYKLINTGPIDYISGGRLSSRESGAQPPNRASTAECDMNQTLYEYLKNTYVY